MQLNEFHKRQGIISSDSDEDKISLKDIINQQKLKAERSLSQVSLPEETHKQNQSNKKLANEASAFNKKNPFTKGVPDK